MAYVSVGACTFAAVLVFVCLCLVPVSADQPTLLSTSPVVTLGVPFQIFAFPPQQGTREDPPKYDISFMPPLGVKILPLPKTQVELPFVFDAVAYACPQDSPFNDLQVNLTTGGTVVASLWLGLEEGARISATLNLEQNMINLRFATSLFMAPISSLTCSFGSIGADLTFSLNRTIYRNQKAQSTQSPTPCHHPKCELSIGDMIGRTEVSLTSSLPDARKPLDLRSNCTAFFGPYECSIANLTATLKPGVAFDAPTSVKAGENIILNITEVEGIQECMLVLPNEKDYHLAGSVPGCTQKSSNITCSVNRSAIVPVHLEASVEAHKGNHVSLKCANAGTQQRTFDITVASEVEDVKFGGFLRVLKPPRFNISFVVTNKGPSDLKDLQCTFSYPDDLGVEPNSSCVLNNETDSYACPIKVGTLAGRDATGKAGSVNHTVTFNNPPDPIWGVSSRFSVSCQTKSAQKTLKVNDTDLVILGKPPVETPMQNDGYFWTYAIVIVNLFVIALVVFVGMWWRNRAIAKTMEGRGGAGGFTEMEIFSEGGGRLPMSKAD